MFFWIISKTHWVLFTAPYTIFVIILFVLFCLSSGGFVATIVYYILSNFCEMVYAEALKTKRKLTLLGRIHREKERYVSTKRRRFRIYYHFSCFAGLCVWDCQCVWLLYMRNILFTLSTERSKKKSAMTVFYISQIDLIRRILDFFDCEHDNIVISILLFIRWR